MIINNEKFYREIVKILFNDENADLTKYTNDDFKSAIFEIATEENYIDHGCYRSIYRISDDIVVKIPRYWKNGEVHCTDNEREVDAYEEIRGNAVENLALEIYAYSDDYFCIFAEKLNTTFTTREMLSALGYSEDYMERNIVTRFYSRDFLDAKSGLELSTKPVVNTPRSFSSIFESELEEFFYNFRDVHIKNVGFDKNHNIKVLDLGYGVRL